MKQALKTELQKLIGSKTFWLALAIGVLIGEIQALLNIPYVRWVTESASSMVHPNGLDNISLSVRWLGSDDYTWAGIYFYFALPLLAAIPMGASEYMERKKGYALQVITRCGKEIYVWSKVVAVYISGFITVAIPLILNLMTTAMICPLGTVRILSMVTGVAQGWFCSELFYTHPVIYMILQILVGAAWGGVCALIALAFGSVLKNPVLIILSPLITMLILDQAVVYIKRLFSFTYYELSPLMLMQTIPLNPNPTWLVCLYLALFTLIPALIFMRRGMKRENI